MASPILDTDFSFSCFIEPRSKPVLYILRKSEKMIHEPTLRKILML